MQIKIAKLHQYPAEIPTGIAVGFHVTFDNDRTIYIDTIVPLNLTEDEAVAAAWENVKASVESQKETIGVLPKLVGSVFTPPVVAEEAIEVVEEAIEEVLEEAIEETQEVVEETQEEVVEEVLEETQEEVLEEEEEVQPE
jgi:DNA-directed RNA polymerase beta' subunit